MKRKLLSSACALAVVLVGTFANSNIVQSATIADTAQAALQTLNINNVDLSNCNSIQDVVTKLQENGCLNNSNVNIKNITSIQDIQDLLKNSNPGSNCPNNGSSEQPSSTTPPVNTGNPPAATEAPTVTQAPATPTAPATQAPATPTAPATQAPATPTAPSSDNSGISGYAEQVMQLVNAERAKQGLSSLTTTSALSSAANKRATEIKQSFSHTRPNGSSFSTVLGEYGISYSAAGENIAYGQKTPQEVVNGWMNSAGHRANILNSKFNKIGIGVYQSGNTIYWSQLFTN